MAFYIKGAVVYSKKTLFHDLRVVEQTRAKPPKRFLTYGGRYYHAAIAIDTGENLSNTDGFFLAWAFRRSFDRIAFLGAGGGTGPREWLRRFPNERFRLDVVDIDAEVFYVAEKFFDYPVSDPRLRNHSMDARTFLESGSETYDLIVLDAYSDNPMPQEHIMSEEAFRIVKRRLSPDGVFVFNIFSHPHSWFHTYFVRLLKTVFEREVTTFALGRLHGKPERRQSLLLYVHNAEITADSEVETVLNNLAYGKSFRDFLATKLPTKET